MILLLIGSTSALEMAQILVYPLVIDGQDCKEDVSNESQHKISKHLKQYEMQFKTKEIKTLRCGLLT